MFPPALLYTFFITSVKYSTETTVRKYENFSAIQILREIKSGNFEVSKTAILTFLGAHSLEF